MLHAQSLWTGGVCSDGDPARRGGPHPRARAGGLCCAPQQHPGSVTVGVSLQEQTAWADGVTGTFCEHCSQTRLHHRTGLVVVSAAPEAIRRPGKAGLPAGTGHHTVCVSVAADMGLDHPKR